MCFVCRKGCGHTVQSFVPVLKDLRGKFQIMYKLILPVSNLYEGHFINIIEKVIFPSCLNFCLVELVMKVILR